MDTISKDNSENDINVQATALIREYAKTWTVLLAYDQEDLTLPKRKDPLTDSFDYPRLCEVITAFKAELALKNESTALFGIERDFGFKSVLGNIEQTFDGIPLYATVEERAAHLLYFVIKDHPFTDGNKRIGCLVFLLYLKAHNIEFDLNDNGLIALGLLVAESRPAQKDQVTLLVTSLLID
jgi:prophage maintenance system killer protein